MARGQKKNKKLQNVAVGILVTAGVAWLVPLAVPYVTIGAGVYVAYSIFA